MKRDLRKPQNLDPEVPPATDEALKNPEFARVADNLLGCVRNHLSKKGNKSPTFDELVEICNKVLETRR